MVSCPRVYQGQRAWPLRHWSQTLGMRLPVTSVSEMTERVWMRRAYQGMALPPILITVMVSSEGEDRGGDGDEIRGLFNLRVGIGFKSGGGEGFTNRGKIGGGGKRGISGRNKGRGKCRCDEWVGERARGEIGARARHGDKGWGRGEGRSQGQSNRQGLR